MDAYLTDLEQLGVFDAAAGLLFARPYGYGPSDAARLWEVVAERTDRAGLPVLGNLEAGHADPMLTLPLGVEAELELEGDRQRFRLLEAPTA